MSDEDIDRIASLRADTLGASRSWGMAAATGDAEGLDGESVVRVLLDESNALTRLTIADDWRDVYEADALGAAIVEAVASASTTRSAVWARSAAEPGTPSVAPDVSTSAASAQAQELVDLVSSASPERLQRAMSTVTELLGALNRDFDSTVGAIRSRAATEHEASVQSDGVRARVTGAGIVVAVVIDDAWAGRRTPREIESAVLDAVARARDGARAAAPAHPLEGTPLAQFAGMDDPAAFARLALGED